MGPDSINGNTYQQKLSTAATPPEGPGLNDPAQHPIPRVMTYKENAVRKSGALHTTF